MKILAVGDFHGNVPRFLRKIIQKEKPDVILSPGDFHSFLEKKLFFKYSYGTDIPLWKVIGKKRVKNFQKKNKISGEKVIHYLKSLKVPLFVITGNADYAPHRDIGVTRAGKYKERPNSWTTDFLKRLKIPILDYSCKKFRNYNLIGYPRSSYPGISRKYLFKGKSYKNMTAKRIRKDYKTHWKRMSKLFKGRKNIIFVSHNVPYRTKLDKIISRKADKRVRGHHYGSYLVKELIKKYQPALCICGHMHENQGMIKINKTLVINPGAAIDKRYAIIDFDDKFKVRFYK